MSWDINKSIETLLGKASTESQHQCAKYVRLGLEAGGLNTTGRPNEAYRYSEFLPKIGFEKVSEVAGKKNQAAFEAQPGDIAVMKHGNYGHICVWCGSQWVSDFKQNRMYPYSDEGTCEIFRYKGDNKV